jgi:hypothetical protein
MTEGLEFALTFDGLSDAIAMLGPELTATPVRRFLERVGETLLGSQMENAPVDTGRTKTSLGRGASEGIWELDPSVVPQSLRIGTNVNSHGFSYPQALDQSPRYHYKGGRAEGRVHGKATGPQHAARTALYGKQTMGWFSDAWIRTDKETDQWVLVLAAEIEDRWYGNGH